MQRNRATGVADTIDEGQLVARTTAPTGDRQVERFTRRRAELASVALRTLAELGYARTSLREIAQNSEFSHGVLHYYFTDKADLITACVRLYKAECVRRYDGVVTQARTAAGLRRDFAAELARTLVDDAVMHRLWYDLRAQSQFEESLRADVEEIDRSLEQMVWRVVSRHAELSAVPPAFDPSVTYAVIDGLFQQSLLRHLGGDATAAATMRAAVPELLVRLLAGDATVPAASSGRSGDAGPVEDLSDWP